MTKYVCDRCGKELTINDRYRCRLTIEKFRRIEKDICVDYCELCLPTIIDKEKLSELAEKEKQRQVAVEMRKLERLKGGVQE